MSHIPVVPPYDGFPPTGGPALRPTKGLAAAVTVLLYAAIAIDLFALGADLNMWALLGNLATATAQEAKRADALYELAADLQGSILIATAVVFIIWFHRSRVNAEHYTRDVCTLGRGWAIGSWFVPIGNLWLPYRVAKETWQASAQSAPDGSRRTVSMAPVRAWWTLWVGSLAVSRLGAVLYTKHTKDELPDGLRQALSVIALSELLDIAAAALAILFVRNLTRMQQLPAVPYAAPHSDPQP
ncbi:DUF4328 domain-containing protein [Streptomyces rimosus]|uniref:DUF4328 domain-containing protein n=1 Tax=Streptomyces rimosus TaxID=1927 RepID=UPI00067DFA99|nr:DUF4328 domain-containing protein [Streptomyces rimosus]